MTYNEFIENIINTRGQWNISEEVYFEMHHITPKCLGGRGDYKNGGFKRKSTHENCIWLYPREHFIAHKLLAEENPTIQSLVSAYWNMCTLNKEHSNTEITPEEYEEARLFIHNNMTGVWKDCSPEEHPMHGKDRSGKNNPFYGKSFSEEALKKISDNLKKWKETHWEEFCKQQSRPNAMNGMAIAIKCVETDQYFGCIKEAYEWLRSLNIKCPLKHQGLKQYLDTNIEAYGYHWIRVEKIPIPHKKKNKNHGWWKSSKNSDK